MDTVEMLTQFGLTRQEASIYLTLLANGDLNGYEAAKKTGISRSNTYTSLASLVEKGGAFVIEGATTRYAAVGVEEFCDNKISRLGETKVVLVNSIPQRINELEGYITIKGKSHIIKKMKHMITEAKERVYISGSNVILEEILPEIKAALKRGIKVVLITDEPLNLEGAIVYNTEKSHLQIRLIADTANVLTGDVDDGEQSTCLYSRKKNLIDLLKDSLKNEIELIEIMEGRGKA